MPGHVGGAKEFSRYFEICLGGRSVEREAGAGWHHQPEPCFPWVERHRKALLVQVERGPCKRPRGSGSCHICTLSYMWINGYFSSLIKFVSINTHRFIAIKSSVSMCHLLLDHQNRQENTTSIFSDEESRQDDHVSFPKLFP